MTHSLQVLGDVAVPVFFVLSGFVIRFVTVSRKDRKTSSLRNFLVDRASRIYSVALPAMLLTLAVTALSASVAPDYFRMHIAGTSDHPLMRLVTNLTFLSQSWGHNSIPFCNTPFWSLSYECLFYVGYGLFFYLRGRMRVASLVLWGICAGPQVLFLLPIWALGCALYDAYFVLRGTPAARELRRVALFLVSGVFTLAALGSTTLACLPFHLLLRFAHLTHPFVLLHIEPRRASLFALGAGVFAAVVLLFLLLFSDLLNLRSDHVALRRCRSIADGTFSIYLMHYPFMMLALVAGLYKVDRLGRNIAVTLMLCIVLTLLAVPLDEFKGWLREWLLSLTNARPRTPRLLGFPPRRPELES